ncbi:unnamed protein product, partial [marine sediment metagenome]
NLIGELLDLVSVFNANDYSLSTNLISRGYLKSCQRKNTIIILIIILLPTKKEEQKK